MKYAMSTLSASYKLLGVRGFGWPDGTTLGKVLVAFEVESCFEQDVANDQRRPANICLRCGSKIIVTLRTAFLHDYLHGRRQRCRVRAAEPRFLR